MLEVRDCALGASALSRALAHLPGAFWLRDENVVFAGAFPDASSTALDPEPELAAPSAQTLGSEPALPRWVGVLPYEAFRYWERGGADPRPAPIVQGPRWHRYAAVARIEGDEARIWGTPEAAKRLDEQLTRYASAAPVTPARLELAEAVEDEARHLHRIDAALRAIHRGDLYQVNLARRFGFSCRGPAVALLEALGPQARAPFSAALDFGHFQVVSTSPELFLAQSGREVMTRPIKGTRPRHAASDQDAALARELDQSEKEQAELTMVIDIERNDFGRLAVPGTVEMTGRPVVVSHPTVHHREATIAARLRPDVDRSLLLRTTMPSGSVTGAPKVSAMELIAANEAHRRGLYTGALGYLTHQGHLRLSMAIRVLIIRGQAAHYFAGGGIVADSDPDEEVRETLWKAEQLSQLVGDSARNWARPG